MALGKCTGLAIRAGLKLEQFHDTLIAKYKAALACAILAIYLRFPANFNAIPMSPSMESSPVMNAALGFWSPSMIA